MRGVGGGVAHRCQEDSVTAEAAWSDVATSQVLQQPQTLGDEQTESPE